MCEICDALRIEDEVERIRTFSRLIYGFLANATPQEALVAAAYCSVRIYKEVGKKKTRAEFLEMCATSYDAFPTEDMPTDDVPPPLFSIPPMGRA